MKRNGDRQLLLPLLGGLLVLSTALFLPADASAGAYIFAGETNGEDIITHPTGYTGVGGVVDVSLCINPASPNANQMEIPVRNIVTTLNNLVPRTGNLLLGGANDVPGNAFDFESVALHEVGHCIGMAHVNAASESGLGGANANYTKATNGDDNVFNINPGVDGVIGSGDDVRGDDGNLHWFRISNNNPFTLDDPVDSTTYARNLASLPNGHSFAANGDRAVSTLLGVPNTESIIQQGTFNDEAQRDVTHGDVATLRLAMAGVDQIAGTSDDYLLRLSYAGLTTSCDVVLAFNNAQTGFAVCGTSGSGIGGNSVQITSANAFFNTGFTWHFNQNLANPELIFEDDLETGGLALWTSTTP